MAETGRCERCGLGIEAEDGHAEADPQARERNRKSDADTPRGCERFIAASDDLPVEMR